MAVLTKSGNSLPVHRIQRVQIFPRAKQDTLDVALPLSIKWREGWGERPCGTRLTVVLLPLPFRRGEGRGEGSVRRGGIKMRTLRARHSIFLFPFLIPRFFSTAAARPVNQ